MAKTRSAWSYDGLSSLGSSQLVAKIQSLCGIRFPDDGPSKNGHANGHLSGSGDYNGVPNGHAVRHSNGDVVYNLRTRTVPASPSKEKHTSNGKVSNGYIDEHSNATVQEDQPDFIIANSFLYWLFRLGASLGNESFYCLLWPSLIWGYDVHIARCVCQMWCVTMFIGQSAKEVIAWPRPESPPAAHLEERYHLEYGMPSTHALVGLTVPFSLMIYSMDRYEIDPVYAALFFTGWCLLTCFSRIYLGMHSVLDVGAGMLAGVACMIVLTRTVTWIDSIIIRHTYGGWFLLAGTLLLTFSFPKQKVWNTARADMYMVLAVYCGFAMASRYNYLQGDFVPSTQSPPYTVEFSFTAILVRIALGLVVLIITRQTVKTLITRILCYIYGLNRKTPEELRSPWFEMPYKYAIYISISSVVTTLCPWIFRAFGVCRPVYQYEY